jgi:hypothetical protein
MLSIPTTNEYPPYYQSYVENVGARAVPDLLETQLNQSLSFFKELKEEDFAYRYHPSKWSVAEVLGHIIDTEWIMACRALKISRGEKQALPGFDQDEYVAQGHFNEVDPEWLIKAFKGVRKASIGLCHIITPDQYLEMGTASEKRVSVRALFYIIAGHEIHHMKVLSEKYIPR